MKKVAIIGGGASGLMAAIKASEKGYNVTIYERKDKIGKKILATGNGRCNFTNKDMSSGHYYTDNPEFVDSIFSRFTNKDLLFFFTELGLLIKEKNGYFYPYSEQASSVLDILRCAIREHDIKVLTDSYVTDIEPAKNGFAIIVDGNKSVYDKVIVATGGKAGIGKKEYCNGYDLLKKLGHSITPLYPSLTQIRCSDANFKALAGVRSECEITVFDSDIQIMKHGGEILFTDYGISGIVSFQVSHCVGELLNKSNKVKINLDLLPSMSFEDIKQFCMQKILLHPEITVEEFFRGIHNKKINYEIMKKYGFKSDELISSYTNEKLIKAVCGLKNMVVKPDGLNDFDQAQVTGGGIPTSEVTLNLESKLYEGLYITGELLDTDGICGGYNLQWAFSTGYIAGESL